MKKSIFLMTAVIACNAQGNPVTFLNTSANYTIFVNDHYKLAPYASMKIAPLSSGSFTLAAKSLKTGKDLGDTKGAFKYTIPSNIIKAAGTDKVVAVDAGSVVFGFPGLNRIRARVGSTVDNTK